MNKTIEEAAREASVAYCSKYADSAQPYEVAYTEFMHGANHIMALPLRDRLTEAEKEMVREMYKESVNGKCELENMRPQNTYAKNSIAMRIAMRIGVNTGCALTLEAIFGKEMFNENKE